MRTSDVAQFNKKRKVLIMSRRLSKRRATRRYAVISKMAFTEGWFLRRNMPRLNLPGERSEDGGGERSHRTGERIHSAFPVSIMRATHRESHATFTFACRSFSAGAPVRNFVSFVLSSGCATPLRELSFEFFNGRSELNYLTRLSNALSSLLLSPVQLFPVKGRPISIDHTR